MDNFLFALNGTVPVFVMMFLGVWAAAWALMKDKGQVGAFAQASVRVILLSTILSAASITFWLYLLRAFGLI